VLFHYKFLDGYSHQQATRAVQEASYWNNSILYKKYLEVLERESTLQVKQESARELKSVNDLVENGFLVVSEEYMMLAYDEERKGGGHALQGQPEDDEAAFYRAKAQAKVQGLRVQRLQRHLKQLEEQNLREVEKLRSALARVRKKNQNLTHQLQSIRASRSWRLLEKLGRLRSKVLSRKR
jgi:flagellar biosynthesis chaperone FliJ